MVGRIGGEEFAIILPKSTEQGAKAFAEKLRKSVEDYEFMITRNSQEVTISVTISSGICLVPFQDPYPNSREIFEVADRALYEAKETGRNQTISKVFGR